MSVHDGFFNAQNGDRVYDADDMGNILDGIITDGVYATVGQAFEVSAAGASGVTVGSGRAWFRGKWIYNDTSLALPIGTTVPSTSESQLWDELPAAHPTLPRYDAVIISVGLAASVRAVQIKVKSGIAKASPVRPDMANSDTLLQKAIAYIYRPADSTTVTADHVSNVVGSSATPYAAFGNERLSDSEIDAIMV